jgi:glycine dehydrogenase subunit 1
VRPLTASERRRSENLILSYLFITPDDQREMLARIGVASLDELLTQIPPELHLRRPLDLPAPLTELDLERELRALAGRNVGVGGRACFLGGGVYDHFVPSVVDEMVSRGEFYTAYTPYQAEASQGSLQAFFEYQSLICELTGLDVANASLYEGASAVAEAVLMAERATDRTGAVLVSAGVHPETLETLRTYLARWGQRLVVVPLRDGVTDLDFVRDHLTDQVLGVVVQHPNFLGQLEDVAAVSELAHRHGALSIVSFDPLSLGLLKRPGDCGVDIAVAEGQSLGIPLQYGGPYLGVLACRNEFVRKMPGRLIGQTVDRNGQRCFVLNLQTREQHIRREKATSNICTNQGLLALRATVYLATMGPQGLREVAELCCQKAHYAAEQLQRVGFERLHAGPFFKEFAVRCPKGVAATLAAARRAGCDVGPQLSRFPLCAGVSARDHEQGLLVAVTESRTKADIDRLVNALRNS